MSIALVAILLSASALAAPKKHTFDGTIDQIFDAAVKSAQANWTVKFADRQTHTLSFTSGISLTTNGMECSVALKAIADGKIEITLHTQKKLQLYAWSAGDRIADKFFKGIESELSSAQEHSDGTRTTSPDSRN